MTQNEQEKRAESTNELTVEDIIKKLKAYYFYLKRNRWKTLIIAIVFAVIGVVIAKIKQPKYTARITFAMHEESKMGGGLSSLASQLLGGSSSKGVYSGFNLLPFLTSRLMIEKTLLSKADFGNGKKEVVINYYLEKNGYFKKWQKDPKLKNIRFSAKDSMTRAKDSVITELWKQFTKKNMVLDRLDKKSSIVFMQFTDTDEMFAKNFIELLADNATDYYVRSTTKKSSENLAKLQKQADSVRNRLESALAGAALSADATPNPNPQRQIIRVSAQRRLIDVEANRAALIEINKSLQMAKITLNQDTPLIDYLDKPVLPLEVKKLGKITGGILGFIFGIFVSIGYLTLKKLYSLL